MTRWSGLFALVLLTGLVACGGGSPSQSDSAVSTDSTTADGHPGADSDRPDGAGLFDSNVEDTGDADTVAADLSADLGADLTADQPTADQSSSVDVADVMPATDSLGADGVLSDAAVSCSPTSACNRALTAEGLCPGSCVPQPQTTSCRGTVASGLCYGRLAPATQSVATSGDGLEITPISVPTKVYQVGDSVSIRFAVKNISGSPLTRGLKFKLPVTWTLLDGNFTGWSSIQLEAGQSIEFSGTIQASAPNALDGDFTLMSFSFTGGSPKGLTFPLIGRVGFAETSGYQLCGGQWWPANWCPNNNCGRNGYSTAVCCDDVFYPGSECCSSADCADNGICADGYCVRRVPQFASANTMPAGYHRVLVVLSDFPQQQPAASICQNRVDEFKSAVYLDTVEQVVDSVLSQRTGRPEKLLHWQWTVLAGLKASDFISDGKFDQLSFRASLESYLQTKGCLSQFTDYDKVLIFSSQVELCCGYGGQAFTNGQVVMRYVDRYLIVHELMHTFGARDTYLNIGSSFQYQGDLMGNYLGLDPVPSDGVMWAEIGLGDVDRSGAIDLFEFAHTPTELVIDSLSATLNMTKSTVEVSLRIGALEDGALLRTRVASAAISLTEFGPQAILDSAEPETVALQLTAQQLQQLSSDGTVKITVTALRRFTNAQFERSELTLNETVTVPLQ